MIKENSNAKENFERIKRKNTVNHYDYGLYFNSKSRRGRHGATVSTASLAWLVTKLLALSQHSTRVGAFTQLQKNCNVPSAQTKNMKHVVQHHLLSPLKYRDIDSEPSLESTSRKCHVEIFRLSTAARGKTSVVRSQMNDEHNLSSQKDDQNVVDEYLESISRRYQRVHQNEKKINPSQKGFTSALAWLNADEGNDQTEGNHQTEDALFVLDLAELASVRLLQKHKLPTKISQQQNFSTNEVSIVSGERRIVHPKPFAQFLRKMGSMFTQITTRARSISFQLLTMLSLASKCMTGGGFASQLAIFIACAVVLTGSGKA